MILRKVIVVLILLAVELSFAQKNNGNVIVKIYPVFNTTKLVLTDGAYVNENGDSIYIDVFKFYLSGICFNNKENTFCGKKSYQLINAEDSSTFTFTLKNIPAGTYNQLSYEIGVDSLKNTQGVLTGDLDPIKGMYWAWNTGYVAAKIEGHAGVCKTVHNEFEYHVGGYLPPFQSLRENRINIDNLVVTANKTSYLELYADVSEWFKTPVKIDVAKINSIVLPNNQSVMMADNYKDMIKYKSKIEAK